MINGRSIEDCLERAAGGDEEARNDLSELLLNESLFVPVRSVKREGEAHNEIISLSIATESRDGKRLISGFTSEDLFEGWSAGRYRCLALGGADIAVSLPPDTGLIINPDSEYSIEFSAEEMAELLAAVQEGVEQAAASGAEPGQEADQEEQSEDAAPQEEFQGDEPLGVNLLGELCKVFLRYPEVVQAYYLPPSDDYNGGLLGLITSLIEQDRRFNLMSEIGQVSRRFFSALGAIEVFDDVGKKISPLWRNYVGLMPFYERAPMGSGVRPAVPPAPAPSPEERLDTRLRNPTPRKEIVPEEPKSGMFRFFGRK